MKRRTYPCIFECPFCGSAHFCPDGTILLDLYPQPDSEPDTLYWKFWCDRCERITLIEVYGCDVPEEDVPTEIEEGKAT